MIEAIKDGVVKADGVRFPKIMRSLKGKVVLFTEPKVGVVIFDEDDYQELGYHSTYWDMVCFEDYDGSITLQNVKKEK
jgi:hypothetical protein